MDHDRDETESRTMIAKEAFDLVSIATFLCGLFLAGLALAVLI